MPEDSHPPAQVRPSVGWVALPVAAVVAALLFGGSSTLRVREDGTIEGWLAQLRAGVQGQSFWKDQLEAVDEEITYLEAEPARDAEFQAEIRQWEAEERAQLEAMYREFPELRPSAAERRAEKLRRRADAIEHKAWDREWEMERRRDLRRLRQTRDVIRQRLAE